MKEREALKLALEAFKVEHSPIYGTSLTARAIKACEEALAQPEQEPVDDSYSLADKVREALDRQSCPDAFMRIAWETIVKHYTTPPQRKPLTDEQIDSLRSGYQAGRIGSFVELCRAIEAAHGIKE